MDASRAEAAAKGVERQLAVKLDMPVLDQIERLAFLAEAEGFETADLGHVKVEPLTVARPVIARCLRATARRPAPTGS